MDYSLCQFVKRLSDVLWCGALQIKCLGCWISDRDSTESDKQFGLTILAMPPMSLSSLPVPPRNPDCVMTGGCCLGMRAPRWLSVLLLLAGVTLQTVAQMNQVIYNDSLQNGWMNYGWTKIDYANTSVVHSGSDSIAVTITNGYQAIYLGHNSFDSTPYTNLTFWISGGSSGGQQLNVQAIVWGMAQSAVSLSALVTNWQQITLSLASLNAANQPNVSGFWLEDRTGLAQPTFYLDDIALLTNGVATATNTPVTIAVDAQLNRHAISPLIYGVAFASSNQLSDLNFAINRSGGNNETRYNWQLNAHNIDADWYFESVEDGSATPGAAADDFVANSKNGYAQAMITIPMIGWTAKLGPTRNSLWSYSIANYGPQTGHDPYNADAGNGTGTNSATHTSWLITTNNPNDANSPVDSTFQQGYVQHLMNVWGSSTNGGVRYYLMDNEHSIWFETHQDVHPAGPRMQEIRDKILDYAGMVKSNDPNALVCAPEEWGWSGYFYSGYDQQNPGFQDRTLNGGWDYMPWLLNQIWQHDTNTGRRLLDYFTLHCYPQGGESGDDVSTTTQLLRNKSTRQFWDTNYVDQSWIGLQPTNTILMLIPRMKNWAASNYPGTKIGITEYNWGAETNINGATAQADILGIFGREGLDLATRWTTPAATSPTYKSMKLYRNYDGNKSAFGDNSVSTSDPNPDIVSAFAALRSSDAALTVMVINKQLSATATVALSLTNFLGAGTAQVWQLTSANSINRLSDVGLTGSTLIDTVPAQSITLFVLPAGTPPSPPVLTRPAISSTNTFCFWLNGQAGQRYVIQSTAALPNWSPVQTNTLSGGSTNFVFPIPVTQLFYRAQWAP